MALFWVHPTPFPGLPHTWQHPCLAFAPAVLPALDTHLPIPKSEDLILQDPKEFPKDPTPSTMSLPLYAVYFSKDLGSHLTPPPALLPQGTKVREDGDNNRRPPCPRGGRSRDWPHRVCSGEQGMGMGGPEAVLRWREGTWKSSELDAWAGTKCEVAGRTGSR